MLYGVQEEIGHGGWELASGDSSMGVVNRLVILAADDKESFFGVYGLPWVTNGYYRLPEGYYELLWRVRHVDDQRKQNPESATRQGAPNGIHLLPYF